MAPVLNNDLVNISSIGVSWDNPGGVMSGYIITCSSGDPSPGYVDHDAPLLEAQCMNLVTPGGAYNISITTDSGTAQSDAATALLNTSKCTSILLSNAIHVLYGYLWW